MGMLLRAGCLVVLALHWIGVQRDVGPHMLVRDLGAHIALKHAVFIAVMHCDVVA